MISLPANEMTAKQIENDLKDAGRIGISGVPFFIFEQEWAISGAHPPESFLPLFDAVVTRQLNGEDNQTNHLVKDITDNTARVEVGRACLKTTR